MFFVGKLVSIWTTETTRFKTRRWALGKYLINTYLGIYCYVTDLLCCGFSSLMVKLIQSLWVISFMWYSVGTCMMHRLSSCLLNGIIIIIIYVSLSLCAYISQLLYAKSIRCSVEQAGKKQCHISFCCVELNGDELNQFYSSAVTTIAVLAVFI